MPGRAEVTFKIDDREWQALMSVAPRTVNSEFNRGLGATMGAFMRVFDKQAFGARSQGKIAVRRKGRFSSGRGGVFIPAKSRKFGFKGSVEFRQSIDRKQAVVRNRSPVAISHELGAIIRPKRKKYLTLRIRSVAEARRRGVQIPRGGKPAVIRVKQVRIRPRLRFIATFIAFANEARTRLQHVLNRAAERSIQIAKARAAAAAERKASRNG